MAETTAGGRYRVNGVLVDAEGKPVKDSDEQRVGAESGDALSGVDFASDAARDAAQSAGLTAADFKGASASGANGYTKPDVQAIVDARG